ncbi:MAG TPA: alpha/beta hydrolase [Thermoanaerobaculia bacterium]|nr:alpha/beta hydrolase [Thermoanaerobaculia bacterium]
MTVVRHGLTTADRAAMTALRAGLAANPIAITRASYDRLLEQVPPADTVAYSESSVGGVPGVWCEPASHRAGVAMLYLHGGVFAYGTAHAYRNFVGHIAARSGVPAFVADYRLAPEHTFPAALDDARAAYRGLTSQFGARHVALVGDSAGGGLALSLLREELGARCGVLLSPWTDLALTGGSLESKAADDPLLTRAALEASARQYLGDHDPRDPRASPLYGPTGGTPPIQVHVGTAEILLDDSLRLGSHDRVEVHAWEDMPHVFPSSIGLFEAAQAAHDLIAGFLRAELAI